MTSGEESRVRSLVLTALFLNVVLLVFAALVYFATESQLVLAQGADSLFDLAAGVILAVSASVGDRPRDENHPFGHQRAEPIGALVTAVLAGVLAFEVLRSSVGALVLGEARTFEFSIAAVLGTKFLIKSMLYGYLARKREVRTSPALRATMVDTRNDVLATLSSLVGAGLFQFGFEWADAALAVPIAIYIGYAGIELAQENLRYLMGEAPDADAQDEIARLAAEPPGVLEVRSVRAQYLGQRLHVEVTILVPEQSSAAEAHDIALAVQRAIEDLESVEMCFVHPETRSVIDHD